MGQCQNPGCNEPATWEVNAYFEYGLIDKPRKRSHTGSVRYCESCCQYFMSEWNKSAKAVHVTPGKEGSTND